MTMDKVKRIVLVLSGKGGVGKSSCAVQLALSAYLSNPTIRVGLLDIDLCGPSIPRMLHLQDQKVVQSGSGWSPVYLDAEQRFSVMSIAFLLPSKDSSVVWRGPKKTSMINQFVGQVYWGDLDYLFIDTPPGTSDEHLAIVEVLRTYCPTSIIVTTPQLVSISDVEKEISFCRTVGLPIAGLIENMSGYVCSKCAHCTNIFSSGGGEQLAAKHEIPFLGKVPLSPEFARLIENAESEIVAVYPKCRIAEIFNDIFLKLKCE